MDYFKYVGGRKFVMAVLAICLVTFAVPVEPAQQLEFIKWIVGFYLGANVVQKIVPTKK